MIQLQTHPEDTVVQNMIRECHQVAHLASSCAVRCIESADVKGMDMCARYCLDAESLAEALAALASRGSPHSATIANCAKELFNDCADQCTKMAGQAGDGQRTMENCASACRTAIESLEEYVKANQ